MTERLRYYLDEHIDPAVAVQLRVRGVNAVTAAEVGRAGQRIADIDQLAYAATQGRVMVTQDRDFITLATSNTPHASIALLQRPLSIGEQVEYLELLAGVTTPNEMRDTLIYCDWRSL